MPYIPPAEIHYYSVSLKDLRCTEPDGLNRPHEVHIFCTNANDTVIKWSPADGHEFGEGKFISNPRKRVAPFLVTCDYAHLIVNLLFEQNYRTGKSFILQGTGLVRVPERREFVNGQAKLEVNLCEAHAPDTPAQTENIPSPYFVKVIFDEMNPSRGFDRAFLLKTGEQKELMENNEFQDRFTYHKITEEIFQHYRHPNTPHPEYAHSTATLETAAISVDWVGPLALPIWQTNNVRPRRTVPQKYPIQFLQFLDKAAEELCGLAGKQQHLTNQDYFDKLQTAVQLYVLSFPYFPDRKYTNMTTGGLTTTEVVLDMNMAQNLDCEDGGIGAAELATELIPVMDPLKNLFVGKNNEYLKPQVCWIYQDFAGNHPVGLPDAQNGQFHGTCFLFYEGENGKQKWLGLDGVNPRFSTHNRKKGTLCNDIWEVINESGLQAHHPDCDIRIALWDQPAGQWPENIYLMQSHSEGELHLYEHSTGARATEGGISFEVLAKEGFKGRDIMIHKTSEPFVSSGLWRFKPRFVLTSVEFEKRLPSFEYHGSVTSHHHGDVHYNRNGLKTVVSRLVFNATSLHRRPNDKAKEILLELGNLLLGSGTSVAANLKGVSCFRFSMNDLVSFVYVIYGKEE
jgi:hypothetical protein